MSNTNNRKNINLNTGSFVTILIRLTKEDRDNVANEMLARQNDAYIASSLTLEETVEKIEELIASRRGGITGCHGFISEEMQVGIGNAKSIFNGEGMPFVLLDNNGRDDLLMNGTPIQMKFVKTFLGIDAIKSHLDKYPDSIQDGVIYMVPKDYYTKILQIINVPKSESHYLTNSEHTLWLKLTKLKADYNFSLDRLCSAEFDYTESQISTYKNTIANTKQELKEKNDCLISDIKEQYGPSFAEGLRCVATGAILEGSLNGVNSIMNKRINGKRLLEYTKEDVKDVALDSAEGAAVGAIRATIVYMAENLTPIPGYYASAGITIIERGIKLKAEYNNCNISKEELHGEIIDIFFDVLMSTIGAQTGKAIWKTHPIIGAIVGSTSGKATAYAVARLRKRLAS